MQDISISQIVQEIWDRRRSLIRTLILVSIFSIVLVLLMPNEYMSKVVIIPEAGSSQKLGGTLGSLADIAGVDLGSMSGTESLSPSLYPKIISSTPFVLNSLETPVLFEGEEIKLSEYLGDKIRSTPFGFLGGIVYLPAKIKRYFTGDKEITNSRTDSTLIKVTFDELEIMESLRSRVWVEIDDQSGSIGLFVKMQDPKIAATIANKSYQYLTTYLENHVTSKEKRKIEFVTDQYNKARNEYLASQSELAQYVFENRNVQDPRVEIKKQEMEAKVNLATEIYFQFASELESSRIQLENQTPVFTMLEPAVIPVDKAYPNRTMILFLTVFASMLIHSGIIVLKMMKI